VSLRTRESMVSLIYIKRTHCNDQLRYLVIFTLKIKPNKAGALKA